MTDTTTSKAIPINEQKPSKKWSDYLQKHYFKTDQVGQEKTNTRIADKSQGITGGTYHIPDKEYHEFLQLYFTEIISKNKQEYLTEKQLETGGPILIDLDFRYHSTVTSRQHTKDHIIDFICLCLEMIKQMYQPDENAHIPFFVFEKESVNCVKGEEGGKSAVTKDGIHMIIGLQADPTVQTMLRSYILEKIADMWSDLPITNKWEDVLDAGISKGTTNWQLYGSQKPNHKPYKLRYVFDTYVDPQHGEITMPEIDPQEYESNPEKFVQLSARYRNHPCLFMTNKFIQEYQSKKQGNHSSSSSSSSSSSALNTLQNSNNRNALQSTMNSKEFLKIRTHEQLADAVQCFLESLSPTDFELRDAYDYTMALPKSYYGSGSFTKWIRVGWALRNISPHLFIVWFAFSAQSESFSFTDIQTELWDRWTGFPQKVEHGLTKRSIMYWLQQDNPEAYKKVKCTSIENFLDQTLENSVIFANSNDKRGARGSGDYDIATVLYQLFCGTYVCVSIKSNMWYRFLNHRWEEIDSGTTLRKAISDELRDIYSNKMQKLIRQQISLKNQESEENTVKLKSIQKRMDTTSDIIQRLSKTNDKKNIMVEAKELFFDATFLQKLDNNPNLLCFSNGIIDFKAKEFRHGKPEDYLSKCTNIPYSPLDHVKMKPIVDEIKDFMLKLFPSKELHDYMWDFLASTLIGNNTSQTFNMFIGIGANGKSVLITLMEHVLGEYKGDVPLTLLTQQRTKIGGLSPELVQLKGTRLAVMQEPSKGDKINEGIMKQVTGGDPIQARAPYMPQMVNFVPQFKLVVCSNTFMEICSQDHGTRRRIRVVDFESLFTETPVDGDPDKPYQYKLDKKIKDKFETWKTVFAAMLVEHAYSTNGNVNDCARVMSSSNSYLDRQDYLAEFIHETMEPMETGCIPKPHLTSRFKEWYQQNFSGKPPNMRDVVDLMNKQYGKLTCGVWRGIRFKPQTSIHSSGYGDDGSIHTHSVHEENEYVDLQEI